MSAGVTATEDYQLGAVGGAAGGCEQAVSSEQAPGSERARGSELLRSSLLAGSLQLHLLLIHHFEQRPFYVPSLRNGQDFRMVERLPGDRSDGHASSAITRRILQHFQE